MSTIIPTREQLAYLDQRKVWVEDVVQWTTAEGKARGVKLRALSPNDRMEAELAATIEVRKGVWQVNAYARMCEELARGIVEPAGLSAEFIAKNFNEAAARYLHASLHLGAHDAPGAIQAARDTGLGGAAPDKPAVPPARPRRKRERAPADLGTGDQPASGDATGTGDGAE